MLNRKNGAQKLSASIVAALIFSVFSLGIIFSSSNGFAFCIPSVNPATDLAVVPSPDLDPTTTIKASVTVPAVTSVDDGIGGCTAQANPSHFKIKYSANAITAQNFDAAQWACGYTDTAVNMVARGQTFPCNTPSLIKGTTYYFAIKYYYQTGDTWSSISNLPSATTYSEPSAPTGLIATAGDGNVTLTWNAVTANPAVSKYNIYRSATPNGQGGTPVIASPAGTSYTDTGRTNGQAYYYIISAVNVWSAADHEGSTSTEASATPTAPSTTTTSAGTTTTGGSTTTTSGATTTTSNGTTTTGGTSTTATGATTTTGLTTITGATTTTANTCSVPNGNGIYGGGLCTVSSCNSGYYNCDENNVNGCEAISPCAGATTTTSAGATTTTAAPATAEEAFAAIQSANNTIIENQGKKDVSTALNLFARAIDSYNSADYNSARSLAMQASDSVKSTTTTQGGGTGGLDSSLLLIGTVGIIIIAAAAFFILRKSARPVRQQPAQEGV